MHVRPFGLAVFHQHADQCPGLDRVNNQVVGDGIELGDVVGLLDTAIGAKQTDGLVLKR
jgi:hypothetical protein